MSTNKKELNIMPLFGDFSLLIIGLFILILLMVISTLQSASIGKAIQTDKYFDSGVDTLSYEMTQEITSSIKEAILNDINKILREDYSGINNLVSIRIDGHTDVLPPDPKRLGTRRWRTNRELSQFRANAIVPIVQGILESSFPDSIYAEINKRILPTGYGPNKPLATVINKKDGWYVNIDMTVDDSRSKDKVIKLKQPSWKIADSLANERNRRVIINILKKGY